MTNVTYAKLVSELDGTETIIKIQNGISYSIPSDPANSDYQVYLSWLNGEEENEAIS